MFGAIDLMLHRITNELINVHIAQNMSRGFKS